MAAPPSPYARVLLATEHSAQDAGAEAVAFALARAAGAALPVVLPIVSNPEYEAVAPQVAAAAEADAAACLTELEGAARRAGVELAPHVRRGLEPHAEIVAEARALGTQLLVIRRRGRRGLLANVLVGEMVSKVIAQAPCSVLIVPRAAQPALHAVLAGIDPAASVAQVRALAADAGRVAHALALPLSIVCVAADATGRDAAALALRVAVDGAVEATRAGASGDVHGGLRGDMRGDMRGEVRGEVRTGAAAAELLAAARACAADLVLIGRRDRAAPHGRGAVGATAERVIGQADCPVLLHVPAPHAAGG